MTADEVKTCIRCDKTKPVSEFFWNYQRNGPTSYCKQCNKEKNAAWAEANREHHRATNRAWYHRNKRRVRDNRLRCTYDITLEEFEDLLEKQGGGCAICKRTKSSDGRNLAVDHDHKTGRIRGILCTECNKAIGSFGDNTEGVRRVLDYLENRQ